MSLFDTLFPERTRLSPGRSQASRRRSRLLERPEPLEQRKLLAVTITRNTSDQFFVDPSLDYRIDSQYAQFLVENTGPDIADAWVKTTMLTASPTVSFGLGVNNEDGLYRIGPLASGQTKSAFIFFTSSVTVDTDISDPYRITVYDGTPANEKGFADFSFEDVQKTNSTSVNRITNVTFSGGPPVIGNTLTMTVEGDKLGTSIVAAQFTPATRKNWLPDVYRLQSVSIQVTGAGSPGTVLYYSPVPSGPDPNRPYTANYTFLIDDFNSTPIQVSPSQFTKNPGGEKQNWDHHDSTGVEFPDIPLVPPTINLKIEKDNGLDCYTPGTNVTYTITVTNLGTSEDAVTGVVVTDDIPSDTTYVSGSPGVTPPVGNTLTYTFDKIDIGQSKSFSYTISTPPNRTGLLENNAIATPPTGVTSTTTSTKDSDPACPEVVLDITKTDGSGTYVPGQNVTYTIEVTNNGPSTVTGAIVTDELPADTTFVSATGGASYDLLTNTVTYITGTLDPTQKTAFTFTILPAPSRTGELLNTVFASPPSGTLGNTTSATDSSSATPTVVLDVTKTDGSGTYVPGQNVTYTIEVTNNGPSTVTGAIVTDELPADTTFVSATGGASYDLLTNTVTYITGTLDPTQKTAFTFTILPAPNRTGELLNTVFASPPSGTLGNTTSATDSSSATPTVVLDVTKTDGSGTYVPGQNVTYTIEVTNNGPSTVTGAIVTDELPADTTFVSATGGASYDLLTNTVTYITGTLDPTQKTSFTFTILPAPNRTGELLNTVFASPPSGTLGNTTSATDRSSATPTVVLDVTKTDGSGTYVPGQNVTYTIEVTNNGPSTVTGAIVTDELPADTTFVSATGGASYDLLTNTVTYITGTLDPTQKTSFTFTILPAPNRTGELLNTVFASPPPGTLGNTTSATDRSSATPTADLAVTKSRLSGPPVAGEAVTYQIVVTNNGPSSVSSFNGKDTTSPELLLPGYTVIPGTYNPGSGVWTADPGDFLNPGETVVFTLAGTVPADATGGLVNTATAEPPEGVIDPVPANNTSTVTDTITVRPVLSITKTDGSATYVPGQNVTYTIEVTNNGPSTVTGAIVTDELPANTTFVSATGGASYDALTNTVTYITGTLAATQTAAFTFTILPAPNRTGDLVNTAIATPPQGQGSSTSATDRSSAVPTVSLTVTKDDGTDRYTPGTSTTYTIIVTNNGPSTLIGGSVTDFLPTPQGESAFWTSSTTGLGSLVTPATGGNDIVATINLPPKGTATFLYTLSIRSTATGQLDNTVTVSPPPGTIGNTATFTDSNQQRERPASVAGGLVIGSDDGCNGPPIVRVVDPNDGTTITQFFAYEQSFRGSVRVATGDVTGDGVEEILVAPGRNRIGEIRVFNQQGVELPAYRTLPFGPRWRGGVEVTAADLDGDGVKDIVAGMSSGAGMVSGFAVTPLTKLALNGDPVANAAAFSFRGFPPRYAGGVMLAAGDFGTFTGGMSSALPDGRDEIVVGSNSGRRATANVWAVSSAPRIVRTILPFGTRFSGGVTLSVARYDSDAVQDILIGAGIGGRSVVEIYSGATAQKITTLPAAAFGSFSKPNAAVFTAAINIAGEGVATNVYGVQGRNGGRGTSGISNFTRGSEVTAILPKSTGNLPPLRIAPLKRQLLG